MEEAQQERESHMRHDNQSNQKDFWLDEPTSPYAYINLIINTNLPGH